jgi:hypothetical protein
VLTAFSGMRVLYSRNLMAAALSLLAIGCFLRSLLRSVGVPGNRPFSQDIVSVPIELTAVTLFAVNIATFLTRPHSTRLISTK